MTKRRAHLKLSPARSAALAGSIRAERQGRGLTQEALATAVGVSPEHLRRLELGVANPTLATVYAVADALNEPIQTLLSPD